MRTNLFDGFKSEISQLYNAEKEDVNKIIREYNEKGIHVPEKIFEQVDTFELNSGTISSIKVALSSLVHWYLHHNEEYKIDRDASRLDTDKIQFVDNLIEDLNEKGLHGLDFAYEVSRLIDNSEDRINNIRGSVSLHKISNDESEELGHAPIAKVTFDLYGSDNEVYTNSFALTLDRLEMIVESLDQLKKKILADAQDFSKKVPNTAEWHYNQSEG